MRKVVVGFTIVLYMLAVTATAMAGSSITRIKDVAKVQGMRSNQLVGYGLVMGLNGTGDSDKTLQTMQSLSSLLKTFGVTVSAAQMKAKNVAAVMVTAQLPPFVKPGDAIDITVSSMGDAKSLQGGMLLQTPLRAANGQIYAVGQGAVSIGGFSASGGGSSQSKNFPNVGLTVNGAIVERDVPIQLVNNGTILLALSQPDFTTAKRITQAIDSRFGSISIARDPGTISITVPAQYEGNLVGFVADLEELYINPDNIAKIIINERTGTIVMGAHVSIDEVAVAHGGLSIRINKAQDVSQPEPLSGGSTVVSNNTTVDVKEDKANVMVLPATTNVGDVVNALNAIGATPRDIISILQAMKAAGALHADLQII
ncbi:MAG: Flagellar P-ring protein [Firmicutes bacterium]|nr:Flagellar P-ring protein [Bacillota bacterium]